VYVDGDSEDKVFDDLVVEEEGDEGDLRPVNASQMDILG
jgi:hypothetical protein